MIGLLRKIAYAIPVVRQILEMFHEVKAIKESLKIIEKNNTPRGTEIDRYKRDFLYESSRYKGTARISQYEFDVYSTCGDDGIIEEIFKRIGTTNRHFVDIGVHIGLHGNTAYLLLDNWYGAWFEGDPQKCSTATSKFKSVIDEGRLSICNAFITAENVTDLLSSASIPKEPDLLSIDIDGNDYWIWKSIEDYRPRVVVIEYNPVFRSSTKWVMKYNPFHNWIGTIYGGASLKSLELLGKSKGYSLVGCTFDGVNAYFVRDDLVKDNFHEPFTAEEHYEPFRNLFLRRTVAQVDFGPYESI
ncbi:MAG: hypothetical protein JKX97_05920 [Candidatus Lindowbacteria bacterium]|nr:hypothetical protein [Candidatus Lindowbacteria bacterium]